MTELEAIEAYVDWQQEIYEQTGQVGNLAGYAEYLLVSDLKDRLAQIHVLATEQHPEALELIGRLSNVA